MLVYATNEPNTNKLKRGAPLPVQTGWCIHPTICNTCNYFYFRYKGYHKC